MTLYGMDRHQQRARTRAAATLILLLFGSPLAARTPSQEPVTSRQNVAAVSARVDRVDRFTRLLTLRTDDGVVQTVSVGPELKVFDELKSGDKVRIRWVDSVIVALRPNEKPNVVTDTTAAARKAGGSGGVEVLQQLKLIVTIESIDTRTQTVVYKGGDNRRVTRPVADPRWLEGLKPGDIVELTYTRERAFELERAR